MHERIITKKQYIRVEPAANELWEFLETLGNLFKMPEYRNKNTIWVIPELPIQGGYDDLYKLRDFISRHYPKGDKPDNKTAIVAKTGFLGALAESWAEIARDLPYEIRAFNSFQAAEAWIIEGRFSGN